VAVGALVVAVVVVTVVVPRKPGYRAGAAVHRALGCREIIEVDIHAHRLVRTSPNLSQVHGVLVVPAQCRVFATATGANLMVSLDDDTGQVLTRTPTGEYPDGLAYDPRRAAIWTSNETGGSRDRDRRRHRGGPRQRCSESRCRQRRPTTQ
jgi:DNA-binding beta-propeller fold protein YncE